MHYCEEGVAVAAEDKRDIEDFGITQRLLDACANSVIVVFRFDDGNGNVRFVAENVVGALPSPTRMDFPPNIDPAVGETDLFTSSPMSVGNISLKRMMRCENIADMFLKP